MKAYFNYIISAVFVIQTSLVQVVHANQTTSQAAATPPQAQQGGEAEQFASLINAGSMKEAGDLLQKSEKPYSLLLSTTCQGQANYLSGFINEVAQTNGNGYVVEGEKAKGSLTEKENVLGERNFDYDKIQDAIFSTEGTAEMKRCLHFFNLAALSEYSNYFTSRSQEFECGLEFDFSVRPAKVTSNPAKKTSKCDADYGGQTLHQFLETQMKAFANVYEKLLKRNEDANRIATSEATDRARTEAGVAGCTGNDCSQHNGLDYPDTVKVIDKPCCDMIRDNWAILGFSTIKDAKPSNKICNDMIDKENDEGYCEGRFCTKSLGECLKNFFGAFAKNAYSSFLDSFDVLGWVSQLAVLAKEAFTDPWETAKKVAKSMFGFDDKYMTCLNKKSQTQYYCQMLGKFSGSSAGFAAGMGGIVGGITGIAKGMKTLAQTKSLKNVSFIKEPIKQAVKTGAKSAAVATVWPYFAARGTIALGAKAGKAAWTYPPYYLNKATGGRTRSAAADSASGVQSAAGTIRSSPASNVTPAPGAGPGVTPTANPAGALPEATIPPRVVEKPPPIRVGISNKRLTDAENLLRNRQNSYDFVRSQQDEILKSRNSFKGKKGKEEWETKLKENQDRLIENQNLVREAERQVDLLKAEVRGKSNNNRLGTAVGVGAGAQATPKPKEEKKEQTPENPDGRTVAPATQGMGTGVQQPRSQTPAAAPAAAPAPPAAAPGQQPATPAGQPAQQPGSGGSADLEGL